MNNYSDDYGEHTYKLVDLWTQMQAEKDLARYEYLAGYRAAYASFPNHKDLEENLRIYCHWRGISAGSPRYRGFCDCYADLKQISID